MAGFLAKAGDSFRKNPVSEFLKDLSKFGLRYDKLVLKNSRSVGFVEQELSNGILGGTDTGDDYTPFLNLSMNDVKLRKNISFFQKEYVAKREELRDIAVQDEIEDILDILSDEAIVYNEKNYFCEPAAIELNFKEEHKKKINNSLNKNFKKIYNCYGFNDDISAWSFFKKWLVDGYLAFEIIYDDPLKPRNVIGFKEIDASSLQPDLDKEGRQVWYQFKGDHLRERCLFDSQIIYISYSQVNSPSRISYVERLVRPFNILRIMEQTRIIWAVVNASYKTKFIIPVGGKSKNRAKQSLAKLMHDYKEVVNFDYGSGKLEVNGKPQLPFSKEYWLPSKDGESPEIETIGNDGPDLSDVEALAYFNNKLKLVSKIPFNRFDNTGASVFQTDVEGIARDEEKFGRFVNRLRSTFQEIIVRPLWIQMTLEYPELKADFEFKSQITIEYVKYNYFEEIKENNLTSKRMEVVSNLASIIDPITSVQYFPTEWLVKKYLHITPGDMDEIKKLREEAAAEAKKITDEMGGIPGMGLGADLGLGAETDMPTQNPADKTKGVDDIDISKI